MSIADAFGAVIAELRDERRLSQEELGFAASCHRNAIGKLERGESQPRLATVFALAAALDVSASELVARVQLRLEA